MARFFARDRAHGDSVGAGVALARMAVLAAAYALAGAAGLDLAVPPGYATLVWPASGVALAGLLVWGRRCWPGVWLGSLTVNLWHTLDGAPGHLPFGLALGMGAILGLGASVQATVGAASVRRHFSAGVELTDVRRTATFLALVVFGPCMIAASAGVSALALAGRVDPGLALRNWGTWYLGDVLGVVVVLPTLLFSPGSPVPLRWRGRPMRGVTATVAICLALSIGVTFALWKHSAEQQFSRAHASFFALTTETERALDRRFEIYSQALDGAAGVLAVNPAMSERGWSDYVAATGIKRHLPGMRGIGTVEAAASGDIARLVANSARGGMSPPNIRLGPGRSEHFIVTLVAPMEHNRMIYGLDLGFEQHRREGLEQARRSGRLTMTAPIALLPHRPPQPGFLLILPLGNAAHGHDGEKNGFRWVYAPIGLDDIVAGLTSRQGQDFALEVFDGDHADPAHRLYAVGTEQISGTPLFVRTENVDVFGRRWTLQWSSLPPFEDRTLSNEPLSVLLGGGLVTVLLGMLLGHFVRREGTISREVERATGEVARVAEQRRLAVEELNESNRLLMLAEATVHAGHWRLDFISGTLMWSDELYHIHGVEKGSVVPTPAEVLTFYYPDDQPIVSAAIVAAREHGTPCRFAARLYRADGALRHVEVVANVELDEQGRPAGLFGVLADRTEEAELRNELLRTRDEACAAADAKSAFLANMSHDIRTPMNAVLGFAELLHRAELPPEQHHQVEVILDSGRNMMSLLNDILDLSKIDAGRLELVERNFDVRYLLAGSIALFRQAAADKQITLDLALDPAVPQWIRGDKLRLRQILDNLMSNAIKFTESGKVTLAARVERESGARRLVVAVSDTGIGIASDRQQRIFDGFTQADSTIHERFGGTGLGLAICARLAALMGGTVTVESLPGEGSTFGLRLPLQLALDANEGGPGEGGDEPLELAGRVLVAEDNQVNRMVAGAMLDRLGVPYEFAEDGEEAVNRVMAARAANEPYVLVFMDIQMPRMGGHDATRTLREAGVSASELPIVGLSANAFPEDTVAALDAGMQAHLTKPLRLEALAAMLREFAGEVLRRTH
ncbi:CHASE domain-containing protein [Novosphingobium sp. PhB165]|uniref:CHASE domain-containing protein n=1 Tax=Novosphingobium sp. PhB165 TaxID=2485105 RepID=UPI0014049002|nr:CHASE domain-containing protein [Novosphingobium sp. PhB165]